MVVLVVLVVVVGEEDQMEVITVGFLAFLLQEPNLNIEQCFT